VVALAPRAYPRHVRRFILEWVPLLLVMTRAARWSSWSRISGRPPL